jgi:glycerol-3-phosphate dehydrogenase (NAD(P)+)
MNSFAPDIGILGAGAWGTALAVLWAREGRRVALWARDPATAAAMRQTRQTARLPGAKIPETIDIIDAFPDAAVLVVCVPMQHLRALLAHLPPSDTPLVLCCKGLESETLLLPPERAASSRPAQTIAILTGPNFAHEIAAGLPAAAVLAAENPQLRAQLMAALKTETLRLYGSADVTGAALGGAAKNVIAIAAGVVMGAGLGENARAALITRGIAEISRLAASLGGRAETIAGLSGLGDLLLTCTGAASRNFSLGAALGRGTPLAEILQARTNVTEGVTTAPALLARAQAAGVDMPVTGAVTALLAGQKTVPETMTTLMARALRDE